MCWKGRVGFAGKISPTHIVTVLVFVLEFSENLAEFCFLFRPHAGGSPSLLRLCRTPEEKKQKTKTKIESPGSKPAF